MTVQHFKTENIALQIQLLSLKKLYVLQFWLMSVFRINRFKFDVGIYNKNSSRMIRVYDFIQIYLFDEKISSWKSSLPIQL